MLVIPDLVRNLILKNQLLKQVQHDLKNQVLAIHFSKAESKCVIAVING